MATHLRHLNRVASGLLGGATRRDLLVGLGFMLVEALVLVGTVVSQPASLLAAIPILAALFTITWRRKWPVLPIAAITAVSATGTIISWLAPGLAQSTGVGVFIIALLFAIFSLGMHGSRRELAIGGALPLLMITVINLPDPAQYPLVGGLAFTAVFIVGAPMLAGRLLRDRSRIVRELRQQEALLRAEQETSARAALAGEKLELGAQLQTILEAGMNRLIAEVHLAQRADEEQRKAAVGSIETTARALLGELRLVLASISPGVDVSRWTAVGLRTALVQARALAPNGHRDAPAAERPAAIGANADVHSKARRPIERWDLWLAAAVLIGLVFDVQTDVHAGVAMAVAILGCFAVAAPLLFAAHKPLVAIAASTAAAVIFSLAVRPLANTNLLTAFSLLFALPFFIAAFEGRRRAVAGLLICLLGALAAHGLDSIVGIAPLLIGAWLAGQVFRDRTRLALDLSETNRRLALERSENDRRIVLEERARMTREVHDVVGHSLTVIALQAGAARRLWDRDREKAESALVTIARVVEEGRLDLSRCGDTDDSFGARSAGPHRQLQIDDLVERAQLAGLTVGVQVHGSEVPLSPDAELAAYRLVQEALTNVLKHVPISAAEIRLHYQEAGLEVAVNNTIPALPTLNPPPGQGLSGMLERVTACGGTLEWGPNRAGEFQVRAWFPSAAPAR